MNIKAFLKVVEIQTKVASVLPFIIGLLFALYRYKTINIVNSIIFLISLLTIDMVTTSLNNYLDHKRAVVKEGYNYEEHNGIVSHGLTDIQIRTTIALMLIIAISMGVWLVFRTDVIVLIVGSLSFIVGILYSFGPIPISRTPLGEAFSGVIMGGLIIFMTIYIQIFQMDLVQLTIIESRVVFSFDIFEIISIGIIVLPMIAGISNIMLANNMCDVEEDIINRRYTLVYYIGIKNGILLFRTLYYLSYITVLIAILTKILPYASLLVLFTFPVINKGINTFAKEQIKSTTFSISVKNFILFSLAMIISLLISLLF
jgi:1,4-dihydroxy-2-naphthoate octaprenyltransferase